MSPILFGMTVTTIEPIYIALKRLEDRKHELAPAHRGRLDRAFAALHGGQAIVLPDDLVTLIRMLDQMTPAENEVL